MCLDTLLLSLLGGYDHGGMDWRGLVGDSRKDFLIFSMPVLLCLHICRGFYPNLRI